MPLQALQSSKTGFLRRCRRCNGPESDSGGFARSAMAQNQILEDLHGLQWLRIRFWRICMVCNGSESDSGGFAWSANGPESDSGGFAWSAMAQNQILEELHGLQWLRIRFWKNCMVCNGSESDSGGFAWSAMAQNQILEELHGLQWLRIRFWGALRTNLGLEMSAPRGLSGWGDATPVDPALARRRTWAKRGSVPSRG